MSGKNIVIFEDNAVSNFNPLALTRPLFELICGMKTVWENILERFYSGAEVRFICRDYLKTSPTDSFCHSRIPFIIPAKAGIYIPTETRTDSTNKQRCFQLRNSNDRFRVVSAPLAPQLYPDDKCVSVFVMGVPATEL